MKFASRLVSFDLAPGYRFRPISTPIYQTATFEQEHADSFGEYDYSRSGNPTRSVLEKHFGVTRKWCTWLRFCKRHGCNQYGSKAPANRRRDPCRQRFVWWHVPPVLESAGPYGHHRPLCRCLRRRAFRAENHAQHGLSISSLQQTHCSA